MTSTNIITLAGAATAKFASHTTTQCEHAIRDIHATFAAQGVDIKPDYSDKLYAELDAARARLLALSRVRAKTGAVAACQDLADALAAGIETFEICVPANDPTIGRMRESLARYHEWVRSR